MRHELTPLVGKPVMASGHLTSKRKAEGGLHRSCISKCDLRIWDEHKTYAQNKRARVTTKTDHLWIIHDVNDLRRRHPTFSSTAAEGMKMYSRGVCFGFIDTYTRSNGTVDYGLRPVPICSPRLILNETLPGLVQACDWQLLIETVDDIYNSGAGLFLSSGRTKFTPAELRQKVMTFRREAERHLTALQASDPQLVLDALAPTRHVSRTVAELLADISPLDSKAAGEPGKSFPWVIPTQPSSD